MAFWPAAHQKTWHGEAPLPPLLPWLFWPPEGSGGEGGGGGGVSATPFIVMGCLMAVMAAIVAYALRVRWRKAKERGGWRRG